jgi:hypothetical protein
MPDLTPEDVRVRQRLRAQLVVIAVGLVLLPVAVIVRNRTLGAVLLGAVFVAAIYLRVSTARARRRR